MNKQTAIENAARAVLAHDGPNALTDPHVALDAMGRALDAGATHDDIAAEMRRQRSNSAPSGQPQTGR
ncbi:hypothetical protein ACFXJ6_08140 [Streptomyces sp. NPDC059218]|uniref:hypothetical protein n=1 Tax=unclassified Streptomyces TaxID=2593676 RepID=UPI0036C79698